MFPEGEFVLTEEVELAVVAEEAEEREGSQALPCAINSPAHWVQCVPLMSKPEYDK